MQLDPGEADTVPVGFNPTTPGIYSGTVTFTSNAVNESELTRSVTGQGIEPTAEQVPDISTPQSLEFGSVEEQVTVEQELTVSNVGSAPLEVTDATVDSSAFDVTTIPGENLPLIIEPGESRNLLVHFTPPFGSAGENFIGTLSIESNDPDEAVREVTLSGDAIAPEPPLENFPIVGAQVDEIISSANCANVTGVVEFAQSSSSADTFQVTLTDQGGVTIDRDAPGRRCCRVC